MADRLPQFEGADLVGSTTQFVGTVGTSPTSFPAVATTPIAEALIRCPTDQANSKRLLYSFDLGVTFSTLSPGEYVGWGLKGGVSQVVIKGGSAGVAYEVIINREPA